MPFISLSCLIALAKTFNTMLKSSGESGHHCLVSDLKKNVFSLSPLSMLTRFYGLYYVEVRSLYSHFAERFYHKWMLDFVKCFFCIYWYDHVVFIFLFVNVVYHINWFADIVPTLHPRNKYNLIMVYDIFNVLLNLVC